MANVTVTVPDALVPDLTQALALVMQNTTDAAALAVATKVLAGQTTTGAEKTALAPGITVTAYARCLTSPIAP